MTKSINFGLEPDAVRCKRMNMLAVAAGVGGQEQYSVSVSVFVFGKRLIISVMTEYLKQ